MRDRDAFLRKGVIKVLLLQQTSPSSSAFLHSQVKSTLFYENIPFVLCSIQNTVKYLPNSPWCERSSISCTLETSVPYPEDPSVISVIDLF